MYPPTPELPRLDPDAPFVTVNDPFDRWLDGADLCRRSLFFFTSLSMRFHLEDSEQMADRKACPLLFNPSFPILFFFVFSFSLKRRSPPQCHSMRDLPPPSGRRTSFSPTLCVGEY